ncbi:sterol desaturase family protein [Christiangramia sabulilitoris]|uniref:Sterol desaturase family protein n=1 Tax=Christiangramia sabulilitoris TaxID=2583991 RepID=A0A550I8T8_9FLAO|nr:sterol desaturase family protein [Christiangramia sabulilitoris]TRO67391.1 sterol desaturase family protein [Christiangramia sabulilitoris]
MNNFLLFFEEMPVWQKLSWIVLILGGFWILEGYYALVKFNYDKWKHARTNFIFLGFVLLINTLFGILTAGIFIWLDKTQFGLLQLIELPTWIELVLAIIVLDLIAQYFVHFLLHKVKWMWRLHLIHHTDTHVDATTGTRHHPLDFIIRESFALVAVIIMGMPVAFYFFYRILSVFFTYFTHANINLPLRIDKTLSYIFVTPNMHKFHHHYKLPWTDRNYGNMLSIWDRIFGTFVYDQTQKIRYGIDLIEDSTSDKISYQLKIPFNRSIKTRN